jgi:leader peptidase (prepilin peptidase)/N-methyltransferase
MEIAETIVAALAGAMVGSFVTVIAHRVPRGESIVAPRSRCPSCGTQIAAYDNVPIASWLLLRGRSRCCGSPISPRYPLTELVLAALFAATAVRFRGDAGGIALGLVFVSMLTAITLTDLERRIIPNRILAVGSVLAVAIVAVADPGSLPEHLAAAAGAGGLLFIVALAYPRGMGLGDVKLTAVMGLFLGVSVVPALLVALATGSVVGIGLIARHGAAARKRAIPFGPFLAGGGIVALFAGQALIDCYTRSFT